jgi:hypothetical protein
MHAIFRGVPYVNREQEILQEDEDADDYSTDEGAKTTVSWLINEITEEFRLNASSKFEGNPKLKSMIMEFIDYLETEYFESALYELLDSSFT